MSSSPADPPDADDESAAPGVLSVVCSVLAALCFVLLAPVLYLTVDLLAGQGYVAVSPDATAALSERVSPAAAEQVAAHPEQPHGLLATVARLRGHWSAYPFGWVASWNPWSWTNEGLLTGQLAAGVVLLLGRIGFVNLAAHTSSGAAIAHTQRVRRDVYNHCYRLGTVAVKPDEQAEAGKLITDRAEEAQEGWIAGHTTVPRVFTLIAFAVVVLLLVHLWVGLAVLCLGGLVWLVAGQSAAWVRRDARIAARRSEAQMGVMRESLRLMLLVRCYLMERFSQNRVERQLGELSKTATRQHRGDILSRPTLFTLAAVFGLLVLYVAGRAVLGGTLTPAGLAVQGAAAVAIAGSVLRWVGANVKARRGRAAEDDIDEFFDRRGDAGQPIDAEFLQPLSRKLDLIEVSYREPGTGRMILEGVSMGVPAGERAAVLCSNPDEARTLAYLLTRFLEPTAGEVRFDGKNTRWVTFESLRTQVAMVLPEHTTFTDTVANNIGCGDSFTRPQVIEAAKLAHAHAFVQRMPNGYETVIGGGGYSLRPGERFRLALARAILRDPAVLVIEEPAEPFDPDSTALIDDTLNRFREGRTLVFLARRSSTVKRADVVVVIQDGKVVASGDHDSLMSGSQVYKALHKSRSEAGTM